MAAAVAVSAGNTGLAALAPHARRFNISVTVLLSLVGTNQFRPDVPRLLSVQAGPSPWAGMAESDVLVLAFLGG